MSQESKRDPEERALDALLVLALRRAEKDCMINSERLPQLSEDEQAAMKSLGGDFVSRLLAGERPLERASTDRADEDCHEDNAVALVGSGADWGLNRAEEIDAETAEELERQKREILSRLARERRQAGSDHT
jgi:hypothetical protein